MKNYELDYNNFYLNAEEQTLFTLIGNKEVYSQASINEDIRKNLSDSLGNLGKSVQLLIVLLEQNNIVNMLPQIAVPQYSEIMDSISDAALKGVEAVLQSHEFDKTLVLSATEPCTVMQ